MRLPGGDTSRPTTRPSPIGISVPAPVPLVILSATGMRARYRSGIRLTSGRRVSFPTVALRRDPRTGRQRRFINLGLPVVDDAEKLAAGLNVALGRVVRRLRQTHVPGQLTLSEASVLARLDREAPATPGELAAGERVKPQAMGVT